MAYYFNQSRKISTDQLSIFSELTRKYANLETGFFSKTEFKTDEKRLRSKTSKDTVLYFDCGFSFYNTHLADIPLQMAREPDGINCRFWVKLDHRSNVIEDKSTLSNHATLKGTPLVTTLRNVETKRYSLIFDGETTEAEIPNAPNINALERFSLSFWIRPAQWTAGTTNREIFRKGYDVATSTAQNGSVHCYLAHTTNALTFSIKTDAGNVYTVESGALYTGGLHNWYNVVVVFDGRENYQFLKLYVNKTLEDSETSIAADSILTNSSDIVMGKSGYQKNYSGYMDDLLFWKDSTLTDAEIVAYVDEGSLPNAEITSAWLFNEGDRSFNPVILDSVGFNTGTVTGNVVYSDEHVKPYIDVSEDDAAIYYTYTELYQFDKYNEPSALDDLRGYIMDASTYLRVPEFSDDFRITGKSSGAFHFYLVTVIRDYAKTNDVRQIFFSKIDDDDLDNYYICQMDETGRLLVTVRYAETTHKYQSTKKLQKNQLYQISIGVDIAAILATDPINEQVALFLNGRQEQIEAGTYELDAGLFPTTTKDDHDFIIGAGSHGQIGQLKSELFEVRVYDEMATQALHLGLWTNKRTTDHVPRNRLLVIGHAKIFEDSPRVREFLFDEAEKGSYIISDSMTATSTGTGHGDMSLTTNVTLTSSFSAYVVGSHPQQSFYSLEVFGDNDHVDVPRIPIQKKFSACAFVKYKGKEGRWGGIFTNLDGLRKGNRLLLDGTRIRYNGQFYNDNERWDDYIVTVGDYSDEWHHFGVTYDGENTQRFSIYFDGSKVFSAPRRGSVQEGDSETWIGKGSHRDYYLIGNIDDLFIFDTCLTDEQMAAMKRHDIVTTNQRAVYRFENNARDTNNKRPGRYNGRMRHGARFSTDVPT